MCQLQCKILTFLAKHVACLVQNYAASYHNPIRNFTAVTMAQLYWYWPVKAEKNSEYVRQLKHIYIYTHVWTHLFF